MFFEELVLHNFGVYRGRHTLDLIPPSKTQPIILIGGLNGVGKTTILDAVQLALFGKLAPCYTRQDCSYRTYLRRLIHSGVPESEGASVELAFCHQAEGIEHRIRIRRTWRFTGRGLRERLDVERDGALDTLLTTRWLESVDQFVPLGIARLVFFDGEKIESLADPKTASQALAAGINSLLGLDVVDRLAKDLSVYERRQRGKLVPDVGRNAVEVSESTLRDLADQRERLVSERAQHQNAVDRARKRFEECDTRFQLEGGQLFQQRQLLESQQRTFRRQLDDAREDLQGHAAGIAPLLLARDLVVATARRASAEAAALDAHRTDAVLAARDEKVLRALKRQSGDASTIALLATLLADDRRQRAVPPPDIALAAPDSVCHELSRLVDHALAETEGQLLASRSRLHETQQEIDRVESQLAAVPADDLMTPLIVAKSKASADLDSAERALHASQDALRRAIRAHDQQRVRHERLLVRHTQDALDAEDEARTVMHAARVRTTLDRFRTSLLTRSTDRIARLVFDGFRHLLRKQRLISNLEIDPHSFSLTLRGPNGDEFSPTTLSAGERQLLAVSLLWGLARASGRPLPIIIDTPLGRLDSTHRMHLTERYFPSASHQVMLLSTDQEIASTYWSKLRPHVGRAYRLIYDDATSSTRIEKGYFHD